MGDRTAESRRDPRLPVHRNPDCTGTWEFRHETAELAHRSAIYVTGVDCNGCSASHPIWTEADANLYARENALHRALLTGAVA